MTSIFISYSRKDEAAVQQFVRILERMKHTVRFDKDHAGGHLWWDAILEDIRSSKIVVIALSPSYLNSLPCALELQYAEATGRLILPVMVRPIDFDRLPAGIARMNVVTFTDPKDHDQLLDLSAALTELSGLPTPVVPNPLPPAPPAPIPRVSILLDTITGQQDELTPADQDSITDELIDLYLKPESRESARFVLEKLRNRPELRQQYTTRIDNLLAMSSVQLKATRNQKANPPPIGRRRSLIGFVAALIVVAAIAIAVLLNKGGPSPAPIALAGTTVTEPPLATPIAALNTSTSSPLTTASLSPSPMLTPSPRSTDAPNNPGAFLTQTAQAIASFTATPTPTSTDTVDATGTLAIALTMTSGWATTSAEQTQAVSAHVASTATAIAGITQTASANFASSTTANAQFTQNAMTSAASSATAIAGITLTTSANAASTATANAIASFSPTPTLPPTLIPWGAPVTTTIYATRTVQNISFIWVPAGCFLMGTTDQQIKDALSAGKSFLDEAPQHEVCFIHAYWLGQFDITNTQYDAFVQAGGYTKNYNKYWSIDGVAWKQYVTGPEADCTQLSSEPNQPRVCVSYYEAEAYANWLGGRLPTEAEWEYAARGPDSPTYPWGNTFDGTKANTVENGLGKTTVVGTYPKGASWVGAQDMAGNVVQWVSDWYGPYSAEQQTDPAGPDSGQYRGLRGGAWYYSSDNARSAYRNSDVPSSRYGDTGFRVVLTGGSPPLP